MKEDIVRSEDYEHKNTIHPWLEKIKSWWSEKHSHGSLLQKVAVFGKILSGTSALQLEYERNVCVWGGGEIDSKDVAWRFLTVIVWNWRMALMTE